MNDHDKAIQVAMNDGASAYKLGHAECCPYGPEVIHDYYYAWHKGYGAMRDLIEAEKDRQS